MSRLVKVFNKIIQYKLGSHIGDNLLDVQLKEHWNGNLYDLVFIFRRPYNNPMIQLENVLVTCDDLFDWIDLVGLCRDLRIVIITGGKVGYYNYFELFDSVMNMARYGLIRPESHPRYHEFLEWRRNKEREERVNRYRQLEMERITRNDLFQQTRIEESRKKRFKFW